MQKNTPGTVATLKETEKPLKVLFTLDNTAHQQDAVKRLVLNNNLDTKGDHAKEGRVTSASIEKQTRDSSVVSAADKKQDEDELRPLANEMQTTAVTSTVSQNLVEVKDKTPTANKKQSKSITPISNSKEEKNNKVVPDHRREEKSEAKYVTTESTTKQSKKKLKEEDPYDEHLAVSNPHSLKLSTKVKSVSIPMDNHASDPGTIQVTHAISAAPLKKRFKASDFKSEPRWDFDDQYLLGNLTPQSVASLLVLGNHGFKKIPMGKEIKYLHFLEGERDYEWLKALLLNKEVRKGFLDYYGKKPREKFDNDFSLDKYFVIHPDFLRYIKNRFLKSKTLDQPSWRIYRPTTGAFLLLTALHLCDQVSAYGYITEGYQKYSDHYYDKEWKRLIFYANHDFDLERRIWKKLNDENIVKLYQQF